jgi:hypothetical protein
VSLVRARPIHVARDANERKLPSDRLNRFISTTQNWQRKNVAIGVAVTRDPPHDDRNA